MTTGWYRGMAIAALAGTLILAAACKDNNNTATNTTSAAASPAATQATVPTTVVPSATATAASAASPAAGGASTGAAQTVNEVMTDNKFSVTAISAKVGQPVTVDADNKGTAIHNFALIDTSGVSGTTKTDLLQSGKTASITFTFSKAGTYNFHCEVHPTEMTGKVTVTQ